MVDKNVLTDLSKFTKVSVKKLNHITVNSYIKGFVVVRFPNKLNLHDILNIWVVINKDVRQHFICATNKRV